MRRNHQGFTLIELLLALMLTSLLTAGLSLMIGQAAREREAMREQDHAPPWAGQVLDTLERDLQQAQWWAVTEDRLVLIGLGSDGLPAQIEYRWTEHETTGLWTRDQNGLTSAENRESHLLAVGLEGLRLGGYRFGTLRGDAESSQAQDPPSNTAAPMLLIEGRRVQLQPLPDRIVLELQLDRDGALSARREVLLR